MLKKADLRVTRTVAEKESVKLRRIEMIVPGDHVHTGTTLRQTPHLGFI